jgi:hypothetical protein
MPKKAKQPTLGAAAKQPTLGEQRAMLGPIGAMLMPGQVRLASREQQPRPPALVPKKRGRGR